MTAEPEAQASTRTALVAVAVVGLVLFIVVLPIYGPRFAAGMGIGSLLGLADLYVIGRGVQGFLGGGSAGAWTVVAMLKLTALLGLIYALFAFGLVEGLPLLIGLGALPLGVVVSQLTGTRHPAPPPRRY